MKFAIILSPIIVFLVWFYFFATQMVWVEIANVDTYDGSVEWKTQYKSWDKNSDNLYWVRITKPSEEIHLSGLKVSVQQKRYRSWFGKPPNPGWMIEDVSAKWTAPPEIESILTLEDLEFSEGRYK